jgi:hypothetical protein
MPKYTFFEGKNLWGNYSNEEGDGCDYFVLHKVVRNCDLNKTRRKGGLSLNGG